MIQPIESTSEDTPIVKGAAYYAACSALAEVFERIRLRVQAEDAAGVPPAPSNPVARVNPPAAPARKRRSRRTAGVTEAGRA